MKGTIEVISASAGSGKTTRIARELKERIVAGTTRPEAVLATTFTNKAAAELKERVRAALFGAGQEQAALQLEAARIGTVNAVCGRLVGDFALELGLSPQLRVLDEDQARVTLARVISRVITEDERHTFEELQFRLSEFDWGSAVRGVIEFARTNRLDDAALVRSRDASLAGLLGHLPRPRGTADKRDQQACATLERCLASVDVKDQTARTQEALAPVRHLLQQLRAGHAKWSDWVKCNKHAAKASEPLFDPVRELALEVGSHPLLRVDLGNAITGVFDLARRALGEFQAEKRALGVLDFVDQELKALELLEDPRFAQRLAPELDLVLIDEFQDTSPLQLQLFMRLAELAKHSVWVGDQKQAIFGFRGTDPALMDAAMEQLLGGREPQVLDKSYRSRPPLVDATSALFAHAFEGHGLPPRRVKLTADLSPDPVGLNEAVEWWQLDGRNASQRAAALANGVVSLLQDPSVTVRDRATKQVRAVRPGDVAVLCRKNVSCQSVAAALAQHGLAATVYEAGLLTAPEARAALLGLRLFIDERDRLAAAELALLLEHPHEPEAWLDGALTTPRDERLFEAAPFHEALKAARTAFPVAGPVLALDLAVEALQLREVLPRWGQTTRRLANLDALRAHAQDFVSRVLAEGGAATGVGLVAALEALAREGLDTQAQLASDDAVVVSTWHAAKGLEWPVTVLSVLDAERPVAMFGLKVVAPKTPLKLDAPLAGRWLRYWPNPFHPSQKTLLRAAVEDSPEAADEQQQVEKQELRLLYVGCTRARDRLVFAAKEDRPWPLTLLPDVTAPEDDGPVTWAGVTVGARLRGLDGTVPQRADQVADALVEASGEQPHPPAWVAPSEEEGAAAARVTLEQLGARLPVLSHDDPEQLGMAVHAFFAADRGTLDVDAREAVARRCLANFGQSGQVSVAALVEASDRLQAWVSQRWPDATWHRELPMSQQRPDGAIVRGTADLVLELPQGLVVVDHKSFPGDRGVAERKAAGYAGQLKTYAEAVSAAWGKPVLGTYIHLAVLGLVAEVSDRGGQ